MMEFLLLLLPVASASGWYLGRKNFQITTPPINTLHRDYFLGLNYLINEQPDKAVDIFIKLLAVDNDTIETHLALGSLFRRRGEVDRAIRIHQNLISRPQLAASQRIQAIHELAQDYLRVGVLDQAESLFLKLVEMNQNVISSLRYLLNIYQQQKDWQQAIKIAQKLEKCAREPMSLEIGHYYCEIAETFRCQGNLKQAKENLLLALQIDAKCVRANLILAELAKDSNDYSAAIEYYKCIEKQDAEYLSEIIIPLCNCFEKIAKENELISYLKTWLLKHPGISIVIAISEYLQQREGNRAAINFVADQIRKYPSLRGLERLIELYLTISDGDAHDKLLLLRGLVAMLLSNNPSYRCQKCGFSGLNLYWLCPGCKNWSTVRPIYGVAGN